VERLIQEVIDDPYIPIYWGRNQKGMVAEGELNEEEIQHAKAVWLQARDNAVRTAQQLSAIGLHKEEVNRHLEPFGHIHVIVTATELGNFFNLRQDKHAHRLMQALSGAMLESAKQSKPKRIAMGRWHLPYVTQQEHDEYDEKICRMLSVARCARVSYAKHDGSDPSVKEDCELHDNLKTNLHMSAFEHQATPLLYVCKNSANFYGWRQYRQDIPNENRPVYLGF